jgi:hypothetical protein
MQIVQLGLGYVAFSALVGFSAKYFLGSPAQGLPGMTAWEFVLYSTIGASFWCLALVFSLGWHRIRSSRNFIVAGVRIPRELLLIVPSGLCAALVIPASTLFYALPVSILGATVLMRAAAIVAHRVVDSVQIRQGILKRRVRIEEDLASVLALLAVIALGANLSFGSEHVSARSLLVVAVFALAYGSRVYLMSAFKNTRPRGALLDERGYFAIEQIVAALTLILGAAALLGCGPGATLRSALVDPRPGWSFAILAGAACAGAALFSAFIFLYPGRNASFTGVINRLGALIAGLIANLVFSGIYGGKTPAILDWISLALILLAVAFLSRAEQTPTASRPGRQARGFYRDPYGKSYDESSVRLRWSADQPDRGGAPGESHLRGGALQADRAPERSDLGPPGPG